MPQSNQISLRIPPENWSRIKQALACLEVDLMPYLSVLTHEETRELAKMGDKTLAFVQKSLEYAQMHPDLRPPFLDMAEFEIDFSATVALRGLVQQVQPVLDAVVDSLLLSGSEAYQAALMFYHSVRVAAINKASPHAAAIYADLSARFPGAPKGKRKDPDSEV